MKLKSSGLIMISVLIARSAAQTEAGSGQEEEEEGGSGSGEGLGVSTEVMNSADYSMTTSDGSLEMRSEVTQLNISQPSAVFLLGSVWRTGEWTELPSST